MKAFFNGQFVPIAEARVSVLDRGFLYGDGLFETIRIAGGRPFRWAAHLERMARTAGCLGIRIPFEPQLLREAAVELARVNGVSAGVVRLVVSRGQGPRGYSALAADSPTLVMTTHLPAVPAPGENECWRLVTSPLRILEADVLTAHKHCNRLLQVLARSEAERRGVDEALLLNSRGEVAEASSGNVFWTDEAGLVTPALETGILPGITRSVVLELGRGMGWRVREVRCPLEDARSCAGWFETSSGRGLVPVTEIDGEAVRPDRRVALLRAALEQTVAQECGVGVAVDRLEAGSDSARV
jgi:branched-chain amino acid aminotransferase